MEISIQTSSHQEIFSVDEVATQANGSVLLRIKDSVMLASVCSDFDVKSDEDFLPLTVQYIEKSYAAGKIPGGFVKRESKPGEFEVLTSRIIDRTLRPLFPKGYNYSTQITVLVLSCDGEVDLQTMALNAASIALYISDIPISQPACAVRIGRIDGQYCVNPTLQELQESTLDLFVSGVDHDLLMIEMRAIGSEVCCANEILSAGGSVLSIEVETETRSYNPNELSESELMKALELAQKELIALSDQYKNALKAHCKPKAHLSLKDDVYNEEIYTFIKTHFIHEIQHSLQMMAKSERHSALKNILQHILAHEAAQGWDEDEVLAMLMRCKKEAVRAMILKEHKRADGRGLKDVRPIQIKTNILPMVHSSALFKRGETQALVVGTLGTDMDAQSYELLSDKGTQKERFMLHYNFPSFSVGEVGMIGVPGRRELGHGNLAKRALEPVIIDKKSQTIRLVSEILESNGSSSMATVCGGSLALCAAGIEVSSLVAGVAMGLVSEGEEYAILTDIMGLEDHDGDMDFKVAGTHQGITAMQMDIKLGGLSMSILNEALMQAKEARTHILNIMEDAKNAIVINDKVLPSSQIFSINPSKIVDVIGQAGRMIKEIIEKFEVSIDLNKDNGEVKVTGNKDKVAGAKDYILNIAQTESGIQRAKIASLYHAGEKYQGRVKKIVDFGAFIELPKGGDGLLHISKIVTHRGGLISSVFKEGDEVRVEIVSIHKNKIELNYLGKA